MPKSPTVILAAMICCACSDPSTAPENGTTEGSDRTKTGYEQSLERAREVEDQTREAAERTERAIEEIDEGGN